MEDRGLATKTGSIQLPFDLQGRLLEVELRKALVEFVYWMELKGFTLYRHPGLPKNPVWIGGRKDSPLVAFPAIDWEGSFKATKDAQRKQDQLTGGDRFPTRDAHRGPLPVTVNTETYSLEDTDGLVEYRCVGVFIAPKVMIDILGDKYTRKQEEKAARHPAIFGPTGNYITT